MVAMSQFKASFLNESGRLLDEFGALLLKREGEKRLDDACVDQIFRILHTVKGSVSMMNLTALSALAHALEELFVRFKRQGAPPDDMLSELFDLLFESLDAMRAALAAFEKDDETNVTFDKLIGKLRAYQEKCGETVVLRVTLSEDCSMESVRAYLIVSALKGLCPGLSHSPSNLEGDETASARIRAGGLYLRLPRAFESAAREALSKDAYVDNVCVMDAFPEDAAPASERATDANAGAGMSGYVSVHLTKLEELQNLASEMILAQQTLLDHMKAEAFDEERERLDRLTEAVRDDIAALRMTPVSGLFQRLHRAVREAGRKLKRDIEFIADGGDIEIDKTILDSLSEALTQIVRNAAVHGIESAEERLSAGKPLMGRIKVSARSAGASAVITVSDDGRGINADKVFEAARRAGLARDGAPETQEQLLDLIARKGVTTSASADEMSGRGMGLDVARACVEGLRGRMSMRTEPGAGASFQVHIPQTLSVMPCVHLKAGGAAFLLPLLDVYAFAKPRAGDIHAPEGAGKRLSFRGYSLPIIDLGAHFGMREGCANMETGVFVILEGETSAVCLYADELIDTRKAAVKPLPALYDQLGARERGISSMAILSDRSIGMILGADALIEFGEGA